MTAGRRRTIARRGHAPQRRGTRSESARGPFGPDDAGLDAQPSLPPSRARRLAVNTAIFAIATALSRVAGLGREVVQANYFGTTGEGSAFTIASQIPNLFSNLFSQAALRRGVRADLHRAAAAGSAARGVPAGVVAVLADPDRARGADAAVHGHRRGRDAPVHRHADQRADGADDRAVAGAVPGRAAAVADRADGRDPAVLRPVHGPRDRAGGLERGDHRRDGRAALAVPRPERRSTPTPSRG